MSPLFARITSPVAQTMRRANFSTAKPLLTAGAAHVTSATSKWRWSNLSARTRRYVVVGLAVGTCVDTYVFYNYWPRIFGPEKLHD